MRIQFVEYDNDYLNYSWVWLNDPEIKALVLAPEITKEGQKQWFNKLRFRNDYYIWGVKNDDVRIGVVGIKNIDMRKKAGEYFGYIGDKNFWGMGIGANMIKHIIEFAKTKQLSKIYLKVSRNNTRAIHLYEKQGFILNSIKSDNELLYYLKNI